MQSTITLYSEHETQRNKILELFRLKGYCYTMELLQLGIYQYNARILELRRDGFDIESRKINQKCGFVCHDK